MQDNNNQQQPHANNPPPIQPQQQQYANEQVNQQVNNVYQAPQSRPQYNAQEEFEENTFYHLSGRIGRLRYISYSMVFAVVLAMLGTILAAILFPLSESLAIIVVTAIFLPILVYSYFIYPIRRLHDLGKSGWLCLLMFIPLINICFYLYLTFAPGNDHPNEYGPQPRPNKAVHWIGALALPVAFIVLSAIVLPAYSDYVERAQQYQEIAE